MSFLPPYSPAKRHLLILSACPLTVLENAMDTFARPFPFAGAAASVTRPVERLTAETVTAEPFTSAVTAVSSRSVASTLNWVAVPSPIKVLMRLGVKRFTAS